MIYYDPYMQIHRYVFDDYWPRQHIVIWGERELCPCRNGEHVWRWESRCTSTRCAPDPNCLCACGALYWGQQ